MSEVRNEWLTRLLSTAPADRPRAKAAVRRLYAAAGFAAPQRVLWFDSPCAASWPIALLAAPYDFTWKQTLESGLSRDDRTIVDRARSTLGERLGLDDWTQVRAAIGAPRAMTLQYPPDPRADGELLNERHSLFFADYLRLCFSVGGFPGYDGADRVPPEIAKLSAGLMEF